MFCKQKKVALKRKKAWGNLITFWQKKKLVTLLSLHISFSFPVFTYWHRGWESPVLCVREYLTGPEPSEGPGGAMAHQTWSLDVVISHNEWQTPAGPPSSPLFLHLPLPCNHSPRKLCMPRRRGRSRESLCLGTFCIIWTYVLWKQALLKIPRKDFRQENTLLQWTSVTFATGGDSLCNLSPSERCRQKKKKISATITFPLHQEMGLLKPPPHAHPVQMHHYIWLPEQCKLPSSAGRDTLPWYRQGSAC